MNMPHRRKAFLSLLPVLLAASFLPAYVYAKPMEPMEEEVTIVIEKSKRRLTVYVNDTPVRSFPVAVGKHGSTPEGRFVIANKIVNPWYLPKNIPGGDKRNPFGTRWMGLSVPNTGGYRYGIHGTNRNDSIGRDVSSGCIRMRNKDVEWLFRHVSIGTPVIIRK